MLEIIRETITQLGFIASYDKLNEKTNNVLRSACKLLDKLDLNHDQETLENFKIIISGTLVLAHATEDPFHHQLKLSDLHKEFLYDHHCEKECSPRNFNFWSELGREYKNNTDLIINIGNAVIIHKTLPLDGLNFDKFERLLKATHGSLSKSDIIIGEHRRHVPRI